MNPFRLARNLLSLSLACFTATAATLTWNNASGGAWNEAGNWTPNQIPGPLDAVVIDLAGNYTITLNGTATVSTLAIGGAGSNPTLLVGGGVFGVSGDASLHSGATLNLSSGGLRGSWIIDEGAQLELSGVPQKVLYDFNLINRGLLRWLGGSITYDPSSANSTFTNQGLWEIEAGTSWAYGYSGARPSIRNEGILRKTSGAGKPTLNNLSFSNAGQIEVLEGRLNLQGMDGLLTGSANVALGSTLAFVGASLTNDTPASFTGAGRSIFESGTLWLGGTAQPAGLQLTGGNLHLLPTFQGGVITNLTLEGIRLNGTHQVTGSLVVSNASLAGNYTILPSGRLDLVGAGSKIFYESQLLNLGTVRWLAGSVGYDSSGANSIFTNQGLWEIHSDSSWSYAYGGSRPSIHNEGILRKVGGPGISTLNNFNFSNAGQIEINQGRLSLQSIGGFLTGTANVAQGAQLAFLSVSLTNAAPVVFTGPGQSAFESGNLWLAGTDQPAGLKLTSGNLHLLPTFQGGVITNLTLEGIRLNGTHQVAGSLVVSNSALSGNYTILPSGRLDLVGVGSKIFYDSQLLNLGTVRWLAGSVGYDSSGANSTFTNQGLWEIHSDSSWSYAYGGSRPSIHNEGILRKVGGPGISTLNNFNFSNAGQIEINQGRLSLQSIGGFLTGTANVAQGAQLAFLSVSLTNAAPVVFTGPGQSAFESGNLWLAGTDQPAGLKLTGGNLHLLPTFQGGVITNLTLEGIRLNGTHQVAGSLVVSNSALSGDFTILPTGRLDLTGAGSKIFYDSTVLNLGTLRWLGGSVTYDPVGANSTLTNRGLWEIHSDSSWFYGYSGSKPSIHNEGTLRKVGGTGTSTLSNFNFNNEGQIDVHQGRLHLQSIDGPMTGSAAVAEGSLLVFRSANLTNTGPVSFTGPGRSIFESGTLWLGGTVQPAGLELAGGTLRLLPTFQGGGISNLFLRGITLVGTNRVQGLLTASNSPVNDVLVIEPGGQLDLAGSTIAPTANWHVLNLGTVRWLSGTISFNSGALGSRFTNANLFEIHGDSSWSYSFGGPNPTFRNEGVVRKLNGTGNTTFQNITFENLGVIEAATGTLFLPATFTHTAGILRPTGGSIGSQNSFDVDGGILEGSGTILRAQFVSGLISPGGDATGDLRFPTGLVLNPAVTVRIHANGTAPGTQHDRLRVTGPVDLGGASLQIPTATGIGFGQSALFLENDGTDPILGTFAGRDEGSLFDVASRLYRLRYKTGSGNDASLIRDDGAIVLSPRFRLTNGLYRVVGIGTNFVNYRIEASTNLTDWVDLGTVPSNGGGEFQFDDPESGQLPERLYRAIGP